MKLKNFLLFCLFVTSGVAGAKTSIQPYDVEVLVFANQPSSYIGNENWRNKPLQLDFSKLVYIKHRNNKNAAESTNNTLEQNIVNSNKQQSNTRFSRFDPVFISDSKFKLKNTAAKLKDSNEQKIVYHKVWQQDFRTERRTNPIYITAKDYDQNFSDDLQGSVSIKKLRGFYHVKLDLSYADKKFLDEYGYFNLKTDGKLKPGKIYYFDHPAFGVLMTIGS